MNTTIAARVLVVDDDASLRRAIARVLERADWTVREAADGGDAAWAAVLSSGVPANTVPGSSPRATWFFMVTGHEELRRFVDGATCEILKQGR